MFGIGGYEPIFFQIALAFLHEFLMRRIRAYTWAKRLGQMEAFGIGHVPPEKRPCPANIGLDGMDGTALSGPEKNTIAVFARPHLPFPVPENGVSDPWGSGQCRLPLRNIDRTSGSQRQFSS